MFCVLLDFQELRLVFSGQRSGNRTVLADDELRERRGFAASIGKPSRSYYATHYRAQIVERVGVILTDEIP